MKDLPERLRLPCSTSDVHAVGGAQGLRHNIHGLKEGSTFFFFFMTLGIELSDTKVYEH